MKIEDIQDKSIIICENSYKKAILKQMNQKHIFLDVKFYPKQKFWQNYLFTYNENTLSYLITKYNFKISIAKMYLNNLYYIENKEYKNPKLQFLANLKNELEEQGLLIYNSYFKNYIQDYKIIVWNYPYLEKWEEEIFNEINATIINIPYQKKKMLIYEALNCEEEISFVAEKIANLIEKGIDINKIKLLNVTEQYYNVLKRTFNFYHIPVKIPSQNTLYNNVYAQQFLNNLTLDLKESLNVIANTNKDIEDKIIAICNKYVFVDNLEVLKKLLTYEFKNTVINKFNLKNYIDLISINDYIADDEYLFLINFNSDTMPSTIKDEEYLTDNILEIKRYSTIFKNKKVKEYTLSKLNNINNLVITYKKGDGHKECYISSLANDLDKEIVKINLDIKKSYSLLKSKLEYAKCCYDYDTYGNLSPDLLIYQNSIKNNTYNTFDNKFKEIDNKLLLDYLNNNLNLSYSSINNFNKCAFRYYLANILKIDPFEDSFDTFIGSLFHNVLEKCLNNNLDIDECIKDYVQNSERELTFKEKFYLNKIIADIKFAFNTIRNQDIYISLDKKLLEKKIYIDKSRDIKIYFSGIVDKILYKEEKDFTYVAIIDYKTGSINTELKYLPYGLSLQLPIYLYLVKKSHLFKNPKFVGFYLQHILNSDITRDNKSSYLEKLANTLKLDGYSNSEISTLSRLDNSLENSKLIKGLKLNNDGNFNKNSKILSDKEIDKIITLTEEVIDNNIDQILAGKFPINPKNIDYNKDISCQYCHFKDICFKKEKDYIILKDIANLDFLGGDDNA